MNWGYKIGAFYLGFVLFMLTMVGLCLKQKDITLVSEDYYKKEIAYEGEIQKIRNANQLAFPVKIEYVASEEKVSINFPEELKGSTGKIQFYRPADSKKDFLVDLSILSSNTQEISTNNLTRGLWVVKLEWQKDGKEYQKEEKLVI